MLASEERVAEIQTLEAEKTYDVVVVGGGAAGLSGALALVRVRRSVLVIDSGEPRNAPAAHMHNFLSRDGTSPLELLKIGRAEVESYGGEIARGHVETIVRVDPADPESGFRVSLADGRAFLARQLLLAAGVVDELPKVEGLAERWGRDVVHCPYCHGWEVRDQAIGILASGPMAVHSALMFRQLSDDIVFFQHTGPPISPEQREQLTARAIPIVEGKVLALDIQDDQIVGVHMESGQYVKRQAMAVSTQLWARAPFIESLGLELSQHELAGHVLSSYIAADARGATSQAGVWVAGNLNDPFGTVIAAAAAGMRAGAMINAALIEQETAQAVAALQSQHAA
jgi:thioredoxin reductase